MTATSRGQMAGRLKEDMCRGQTKTPDHVTSVLLVSGVRVCVCVCVCIRKGQIIPL